MSERGGMVLSRNHAEKLLTLLSTTKSDLVKCWRNSFNPDLVTISLFRRCEACLSNAVVSQKFFMSSLQTFFPTMLSILGLIPKRNQNHFTTQSRSIAEGESWRLVIFGVLSYSKCFPLFVDLSRRESYTESGMTRLLRQPLTYLHYLDLSIYSTTIDKVRIKQR